MRHDPGGDLGGPPLRPRLVAPFFSGIAKVDTFNMATGSTGTGSGGTGGLGYGGLSSGGSFNGGSGLGGGGVF